MEKIPVPLKEKLESYVNNKEITQGYLGGHTNKIFTRLDDNSDEYKARQEKSKETIEKTVEDSLFFGELIKDLMTGKSHYVTYLNSAIVNKKNKDISIPRHISCLVKYIRNNQKSYFNECAGSRLANLVGIDTVYNIAYESPYSNTYDGNKWLPEYDSLISVDYIPYGYTSETFDDNDIDIFFNGLSDLGEIMEQINAKFPRFAKLRNFNITEEGMKKFKEDFARLYIFRLLICSDFDVASKNTSVLISEDGSFKLGPCFDMEYFFDYPISDKDYMNNTRNTYDYMNKNMPGVFEELVSTCKKALENGSVKKCLYNTLKTQNDNIRSSYSIVEKNIKTLDLFVTNIKNTKRLMNDEVKEHE